MVTDFTPIRLKRARRLLVSALVLIPAGLTGLLLELLGKAGSPFYVSGTMLFVCGLGAVSIGIFWLDKALEGLSVER